MSLSRWGGWGLQRQSHLLKGLSAPRHVWVPGTTFVSMAQCVRVSGSHLSSVCFLFYIGSFCLNQKYTLHDFLAFITYPSSWKLSAFPPFVDNISAIGLWIFKQYNFCLAPGDGSSTLCLSFPSSAVTLCPLVLLKCHQGGPQLILGKESSSSRSWITQCCGSTGKKKGGGTPCSIFIFLIILIMHYHK